MLQGQKGRIDGIQAIARTRGPQQLHQRPLHRLALLLDRPQRLRHLSGDRINGAVGVDTGILAGRLLGVTRDMAHLFFTAHAVGFLHIILWTTATERW